MRYYVKLNMPTGTGHEVSTITVDHPSTSCDEFSDVLAKQEFVCLKQVHRIRLENGDIRWKDSGDIIVNTYHIGSVKEFIEMEDDERPQRAYMNKKRMQYR